MKLLIKDNFDNQDPTNEKFNAEKIEMFFLILLKCEDFQEKNQIVLDLNQVTLLLQVIIKIKAIKTLKKLKVCAVNISSRL